MPLFVTLQTVSDPFEIDQKFSEPKCDEETTTNVCSDFLNDCLDKVFSKFNFQKYAIQIEAFTTVPIKVYLKSMEAGYYLEKFQLNIYELQTQNMEYLGGQVIYSLIFFSKNL